MQVKRSTSHSRVSVTQELVRTAVPYIDGLSKVDMYPARENDNKEGFLTQNLLQSAGYNLDPIVSDLCITKISYNLLVVRRTASGSRC